MATTPHGNGTVGWVAEPTTRGTSSLLFSCVSTTLICTWSALHLNVPLRQDASDTALFLRKLSYLIVALLAPEFIAMFAFRDWATARTLTEKMRTRAGQREWSSPLSFFVVMSGVLIQYPSGKTLPLQARGAHKFFGNNWINPNALSLKAVKDKSKANGFNKVVASGQITWFLSQLVGRAAARITITPLELFTLSYIVCAFATYGFWWNKPFDVEVALVLPTEPSFPPGQEWHYRKRSHQRLFYFREFGDGLTMEGGSLLSVVFFMFISTLFGACHLAGWNAHFPTPVERLLWRIGSACCVGLPILAAAFSAIRRVMNLQWDASSENIVAIVIITLYAIVRAFLLFEAFFSLRSVYPDVYEGAVPWAQYIPHI